MTQPQVQENERNPWGYQRQSLVDRSLCRIECAAKGHRWWRVIDARVCGNCGKVEGGH